MNVSVSVDQHQQKHQQDSNINDCQNNNELLKHKPNTAHVQQQDKYKINPTCNMSMLTETSTNSALASGRWVVQDEYARPIHRVNGEPTIGAV
jgi:hypothetical protein